MEAESGERLCQCLRSVACARRHLYCASRNALRLDHAVIRQAISMIICGDVIRTGKVPKFKTALITGALFADLCKAQMLLDVVELRFFIAAYSWRSLDVVLGG